MSNALIITVVVLALLISITIIIVFVVKLKKSVSTATTSGTTWVAPTNSNPTNSSGTTNSSKPTNTYNKGTTLSAGQSLLVGDFLQVKNKDNIVYTAQLDGLSRRLVITDGSTSYPAIGVELNPVFKTSGTVLLVQSDGNLVILFTTGNDFYIPCWAASTLAPNVNTLLNPTDHNTRAVLGQDGILTAYDSTGAAWWSSRSGRLRTAK
jgi:hypothetical protein